MKQHKKTKHKSKKKSPKKITKNGSKKGLEKGSKKNPVDIFQTTDEKIILQPDETEQNKARMTPDNEWTVLTDKKKVDVTSTVAAERPGRF